MRTIYILFFFFQIKQQYPKLYEYQTKQPNIFDMNESKSEAEEVKQKKSSIEAIESIYQLKSLFCTNCLNQLVD